MNGDLEAVVRHAVRSEFGKRLFAGTTDTHQQYVPLAHTQTPRDTQDMPQCIVEHDDVHLLGRKLIVVSPQKQFYPGTKFIDSTAQFIDLGCFRHQDAVFVVFIVPHKVHKKGFVFLEFFNEGKEIGTSCY